MNNYENKAYRYGFNGMERDDEMKGAGNSVDFGARMLDSRLGRFLSLDAYKEKFPFSTPFSYVANNPIHNIDADGNEPSTNQISGLNDYITELRNNKHIKGSYFLYRFHNAGHFPEEYHGHDNFRYLYSDKWGYIDMYHFSYHCMKGDLLGSSWTLKDGEKIEMNQEKESSRSMWDYEDLVSNALGAGFAIYLKQEENSKNSFVDNLNNYLTELGFYQTEDDIKALKESNYYKIPSTQNDDATGPLNFTYEPTYAPKKDDRTSVTDILILNMIRDYISSHGNTENRRTYIFNDDDEDFNRPPLNPNAGDPNVQ